ncbi:MAG: glycosyltransferase [Mangrovibacterium sp.]
MLNKKIHIVSFNVPYPPDYGGIIDIYFKIKALHQAGAHIRLHCFEYDRPPAPELEKLCDTVYYYPRKLGSRRQLSWLPYIVNTRNHQDLLANLLADISPVLFEGLHSCYFLDHPLLAAYPKLVRAHNLEHAYYHSLGQSENTYRKYYYLIEALRLKYFERKLQEASLILGISATETDYFQEKYGHSLHLPAFHPFTRISSQEGKGDYILYHGNLSISENQQAVKFLLDEVFSEITCSFVIAGKNPPGWLVAQIKDIPHVTLIENPSIEKMDVLIREAHICLIPTFQSTGLKLKLLASLFGGRHCITTPHMLEGTGLNDLCHIAGSAPEMIGLINTYMKKSFTLDEIYQRKQQLDNLYSNEKNAQKIMAVL